MSARTSRVCLGAGLLALALTVSQGTLAQSTGNDAGLEAVGKCAATHGTAQLACGTARKGVLDYLAKTSEEQAWVIGMSCGDGDNSDAAHDKFVEIRRQAREWGKNPGNQARISTLAKITGSDNTMCMLNAIVGSKNCTALLVAYRDGFHKVDPADDPTQGWRAKFCK